MPGRRFVLALCLGVLISAGCGEEPEFRDVDVTYPTVAELRTDLGVPAPDRRSRTLTVGVDAGTCAGVHESAPRAARVEVEETPDAVLLRAWARYEGKVARRAGDACAGIGGIDVIRVRLADALGPRAVVDLRGGIAVRDGEWSPTKRPVIKLRPAGRGRLRRLRERYDLGWYARPPWTCARSSASRRSPRGRGPCRS